MKIFQRTALLLGESFVDKAANTRVILFGIGGVGSWCAEALIRAGIGHLTLVDSDVVSATNINRQLLATTKTVGKVKTEVLKERLLEINPNVKITALKAIYCPETADSFELDAYDFIIDAIDSFANKIHLILQATRTNAVFLSSMGAALKTDPTRIQVAEFWKVHGCKFAAALRKQIRRMGERPGKKFRCVYSDEIFNNRGEKLQSKPKIEPKLQSNGVDQDWDSKKATINGTTSYMPAMFGMMLAGLVTQEMLKDNI